MANRGAIRLDKVQSTVNGGIFNAVADVDLDNGMVVTLKGLKTGHADLFEAAAPEAIGDQIYLVTSPEVVYEEGKGILDFYNVTGERVRVHQLKQDDIVTITDNVIEGATTVGECVIVAASSTKLKANASAPTEGTYGKVISKEKLFGEAATVIMIQKADKTA